MKFFNLVIVLLLTVTLITGCSSNKVEENTIDDVVDTTQDTTTPIDKDTTATEDEIDSTIDSEIENLIVEDEEIDLGEMY